MTAPTVSARVCSSSCRCTAMTCPYSSSHASGSMGSSRSTGPSTAASTASPQASRPTRRTGPSGIRLLAKAHRMAAAVTPVSQFPTSSIIPSPPILPRRC